MVVRLVLVEGSLFQSGPATIRGKGAMSVSMEWGTHQGSVSKKLRSYMVLHPKNAKICQPLEGLSVPDRKPGPGSCSPLDVISNSNSADGRHESPRVQEKGNRFSPQFPFHFPCSLPFDSPYWGNIPLNPKS